MNPFSSRSVKHFASPAARACAVHIPELTECSLANSSLRTDRQCGDVAAMSPHGIFRERIFRNKDKTRTTGLVSCVFQRGSDLVKGSKLLVPKGGIEPPRSQGPRDFESDLEQL